jgi:hypothetical protein
MIYDSLTINFGTPRVPAYGVNIDTIVDARGINSLFIGVHETTKYLYIPVDRYVAISKPLPQELKGIFSIADDDFQVDKYKLLINEFDVSIRKQFFTKKYIAHVNITLFSINKKGDHEKLGYLLYETTSSPKGFMPDAKMGYEVVLDSWKERFVADMVKLSACPQADINCRLPNLINESQSLRKNLLINIETAIWHDAWLTDGEIIFSRPESQSRFYRNAFCIRYRNEEKFQSYESSLANDQLNFRLSNNFVFTIKSKLFLGINLWSDTEYQDRGFEDVLLLDYSLGQYLLINPYYRKGITGGVGIMGSATYIYSEGFSLKPFLTLQLGIKL